MSKWSCLEQAVCMFNPESYSKAEKVKAEKVKAEKTWLSREKDERQGQELCAWLLGYTMSCFFGVQNFGVAVPGREKIGLGSKSTEFFFHLWMWICEYVLYEGSHGLQSLSKTWQTDKGMSGWGASIAVSASASCHRRLTNGICAGPGRLSCICCIQHKVGRCTTQSKGIFVPLQPVTFQPPLWDYSDLCLQCCGCKSEQPCNADWAAMGIKI